jgi:hypothetical protein
LFHSLAEPVAHFIPRDVDSLIAIACIGGISQTALFSILLFQGQGGFHARQGGQSCDSERQQAILLQMGRSTIIGNRLRQRAETILLAFEGKLN